MSSQLRRSQRGKQKLYQAGDLVEIVLDKGVSAGQLLYKTEEGKTARWLVTFEEKHTKDQEVCEKSLGKVIQSGALSQQREPPKKETFRAQNQNMNSSRNPTKDSIASISSNSTISEKKVSKSSYDTSGTPSSLGRKRKVASSTNVASEEKKRKENQTDKKNTEKKIIKEKVVTVKYSTGTLYLHRGDNPRAVFVWKF